MESLEEIDKEKWAAVKDFPKDPMSCFLMSIPIAHVLGIMVLLICVIFRIGFSIQAPEVRVDLVTIHPFTISSSSRLTANWNVELSTPNLRRHRYRYDNMKAFIIFKDGNISSLPIGPYIFEGGRLKWRARFVASSKIMSRGAAMDALREKEQDGVTLFTLQVVATIVGSTNVSSKQKGQWLVTCENLQVEYFSNPLFGNLYQRPRTCNSRLDNIVKV